MKEYRTKQISFRVTESEYARISERMQEAGVNHPSAYLRKMAMDGYILKLDLVICRRFKGWQESMLTI